jgi:hypothetical protein
MHADRSAACYAASPRKTRALGSIFALRQGRDFSAPLKRCRRTRGSCYAAQYSDAPTVEGVSMEVRSHHLLER